MCIHEVNKRMNMATIFLGKKHEACFPTSVGLRGFRVTFDMFCLYPCVGGTWCELTAEVMSRGVS